MQSLNIGGRLLDLSHPRVMGVINVTPDSFFAGSRIENENSFVQRVEKMIEEGVDIIDIGAFSSRPGAKMISVEEELLRLEPYIDLLARNFPDIILSIDSYRSAVISRLADKIPFIINDITGYAQDPSITDIAVSNGFPYVLMHMQGMPEYMQDNPSYQHVCDELLRYFAERLHQLKAKGVYQVLVDPGFGFGKTPEHNFEILSGLSAFKVFEKPVLVGLSRKSMICKTLKVKPQDALNGTTALHMVALLNGASILRAHDVREAVETVRLYNKLQMPVNK